jgi:hypothetical protein
VADDYYYNLEVGGIKSLKDIINLDAFWKDVRTEYSNGKPVFKGCHYLHGVSDDDEAWEIWKFTWDDDDLIKTEGPLPGAWSNRGGLRWDSAGESRTTATVTSQRVSDPTANGTLIEILSQLKIMNIHLSILTRQEIT